jgi:hypothetical protein
MKTHLLFNHFFNPQMNWLIDKMHARAFLSFRLSPSKAEELYCILNMYANHVAFLFRRLLSALQVG